MTGSSSPYYPPRARWYRGLYSFAYACCRALHLEALALPESIPFRDFLMSLLIPGWSFLQSPWKIVGKAMLGAWALSGFIFVTLLGYFIADAAFGVMISLHVSSILYLLHRTFPVQVLGQRILLSLGVLLVVSQLIYGASVHWIQNHWLLPVKANGKVYVVHRSNSNRPWYRGHLAACRLEGTADHGVRIREGFILDRVLAEPGDRVEFQAGQYLVNGVVASSLPFMPTQGSIVLNEETWMVWPSLHRVSTYEVDRATISATVLPLSMVSREQFVGTPFRRWFWRKQTL